MSMRYEVKQTGESHWQIWDNEVGAWVCGSTKRPRMVNRPGKADRIVARLIKGGKYAISGKEFLKWIEKTGKSGAECAELLGVSLESMTNYKQRGGSKMVALACRQALRDVREAERKKRRAAIIAGIEHYGETNENDKTASDNNIGYCGSKLGDNDPLLGRPD